MPFSRTNPDDPNGAGDFAGDVDSFDIDPETGQITVAKKLDFDANPTDGKCRWEVHRHRPGPPTPAAKTTRLP